MRFEEGAYRSRRDSPEQRLCVGRQPGVVSGRVGRDPGRPGEAEVGFEVEGVGVGIRAAEQVQCAAEEKMFEGLAEFDSRVGRGEEGFGVNFVAGEEDGAVGGGEAVEEDGVGEFVDEGCGQEEGCCVEG